MNKISSILACLVVTSLASACDDVEGRAVYHGGDRIVRGDKAEDGEFPHQAALFKAMGSEPEAGYDAQFCGGTLIESEWVLTAAHCVTGNFEQLSRFVRNGKLTVGVGNIDLAEYERGDDIAVREVYVHPGATDEMFAYDFALIRLAEPVEGATGLGMLARPNTNVDFDEEGEIIGWGSYDIEGWGYPTHLRKATVPIMSGDDCVDMYTDFYGEEYDDLYGEDPSEVVCAGGSSEVADACDGDSGGPLLATTKMGKPKIIGVVSGADVGYCGASLPTYYSRVSTAYHWIADCVEDPDSCESLVPGI